MKKVQTSRSSSSSSSGGGGGGSKNSPGSSYLVTNHNNANTSKSISHYNQAQGKSKSSASSAPTLIKLPFIADDYHPAPNAKDHRKIAVPLGERTERAFGGQSHYHGSAGGAGNTTKSSSASSSSKSSLKSSSSVASSKMGINSANKGLKSKAVSSGSTSSKFGLNSDYKQTQAAHSTKSPISSSPSKSDFAHRATTPTSFHSSQKLISSKSTDIGGSRNSSSSKLSPSKSDSGVSHKYTSSSSTTKASSSSAGKGLKISGKTLKTATSPLKSPIKVDTSSNNKPSTSKSSKSERSDNTKLSSSKETFSNQNLKNAKSLHTTKSTSDKSRHSSGDKVCKQKLMNGTNKNVKDVKVPAKQPSAPLQSSSSSKGTTPKLQEPKAVSPTDVYKMRDIMRRNSLERAYKMHTKITNSLERKMAKRRKKIKQRNYKRILRAGINYMDKATKGCIFKEVGTALKPFRLGVIKNTNGYRHRYLHAVNKDSDKGVLKAVVEHITENSTAAGTSNSQEQKKRITKLLKRCRKANQTHQKIFPANRPTDTKNADKVQKTNITKTEKITLKTHIRIVHKANAILGGRTPKMLNKIRKEYFKKLEERREKRQMLAKVGSTSSRPTTQRKQDIPNEVPNMKTTAKSKSNESAKNSEQSKKHLTSSSLLPGNVINLEKQKADSLESEKLLSKIMPPPKYPAPRANKIPSTRYFESKITESSLRRDKRETTDSPIPVTSFKAIIRQAGEPYKCPAGCSVKFDTQQEMLRHYRKRHKSLSPEKDAKIPKKMGISKQTNESQVIPVSHIAGPSRLASNNIKVQSKKLKSKQIKDAMQRRKVEVRMRDPNKGLVTERELRYVVAVEALKANLALPSKNSKISSLSNIRDKISRSDMTGSVKNTSGAFGASTKRNLTQQPFDCPSYLRESNDFWSTAESRNKTEYWENQVRKHESITTCNLNGLDNNWSQRKANSAQPNVNSDKAAAVKTQSDVKISVMNRPLNHLGDSSLWELAGGLDSLSHMFSNSSPAVTDSETVPNNSDKSKAQEAASVQQYARAAKGGSLFNYERPFVCIANENNSNTNEISELNVSSSPTTCSSVTFLANLSDKFPLLDEKIILNSKKPAPLNEDMELFDKLDWRQLGAADSCDKCNNTNITKPQPTQIKQKARKATQMIKKKKKKKRPFDPQILYVKNLLPVPEPIKPKIEREYPPIRRASVMEHSNQLTEHKRKLDVLLKKIREDKVLLNIPPIPKFVPVGKDAEKFVRKCQPLADNEAKRIITTRCVTLAGISGYEAVDQKALEVVTDIAEDFYKRMGERLKEICERESLNLDHGFPDPIERVLVEIGFGGMRGINKYYKTRVIDHHKWLFNQCEKKRRALAKSINEKRKSTTKPETQYLGQTTSVLTPAQSPPVVSLISPPSSPMCQKQTSNSSIASPGNNRTLLEILSSMDSGQPTSGFADSPLSKGNTVDLEKSNLLRLNFFEEVTTNDENNTVILASGSSPSVTQ